MRRAVANAFRWRLLSKLPPPFRQNANRHEADPQQRPGRWFGDGGAGWSEPIVDDAKICAVGVDPINQVENVAANWQIEAAQVVRVSQLMIPPPPADTSRSNAS